MDDHRKVLLFAFFLSIFSQNSARAAAEPSDQVRGFYSHGSLHSASALDLEGLGFVRIFPHQARQWGSEGIVLLIESVAREMKQNYPEGERLQIGDLAAQDGGTVDGHVSHQNGLDVDVGYLRMDHTEQDVHLPTTDFQESFVTPKGQISKNFDLIRNWALMKNWTSTGRIDRIFVDGAVKKAFCRHILGTDGLSLEVSDSETLRRIRPYPNHKNHMHVRLNCPMTSPRCESQEDISPGPGCSPKDFP